MQTLKSLEEIGFNHGTDKSMISHKYLGFYESFLSRYRHDTFNLLEIGAYKGSSIRMWLDYFPNAHVYCLDIDQSALDSVEPNERYHPILADQSNPELLIEIGSSVKPRVVIEDGSHCWHHQIITLKYLLPCVTSDGVYIMEDTETSFGLEYQETFSLGYKINPVAYMNKIAGLVNSKGFGFYDFDDEFSHYCMQALSSVSFYPHTILCTKRDFYYQA